MKKLLVLFVALLLMSGLVFVIGCGTDESSREEEDEVAREEEIANCEEVLREYVAANMTAGYHVAWVEQVELSDDGKTATAYMGEALGVDEYMVPTDNKDDWVSFLATCKKIEAEKQGDSWIVTSCVEADPDNLKSSPPQP